MIRQAVAAFAMSGKPKNLNHMVNSTVIEMIFLACYVAVVAQPYVWGESIYYDLDHDVYQGHDFYQSRTGNYKTTEVVAMTCASIGILNGEILSIISLKFLQDKAKESFD